MARKREKQPITLLIVPPRPERAPVSLRFPTWVLPLFLILLLGFFLAVGYFVDSRGNLERELAQYRRIVSLEDSRQREMRETILAQQEEAKRLAEQVAQFQEGLAEVDQLSDQVRQMMGLVTPTPTPTATLTVTIASEGAAVGGQVAMSPGATAVPLSRATSSRGQRPSMGMVSANEQQLAVMEGALPLHTETLNTLIAEANKRLERIDPDKRATKEQLEYEMKLLAAAPNLQPLDGDPGVSSGFGYRVLNKVREFHEGIDFSIWYGAKVMATRDGKVISADWRQGYGWTVEIQHEMGFSTLYAHNSRLLVKKGALVKAGDVIARSGSTGRSTGPHLHYEIQLNGKPVDPTKYMGFNTGE